MRARDHGFAPGLLPTGPENAITDVPGVRVGHANHHPDHTGVTCLWPHGGDPWLAAWPAATGVLNGAAEMAGKAQIDEWHHGETPIALTATPYVGAVYASLTRVLTAREPRIGRDDVIIPIAAECDPSAWVDVRDGPEPDDALVARALDGAAAGPVAEGQVGAGVGMESFGYAAGIGTSSRRAGGYTLGVLVLSNFGWPERLTVCGYEPGGALEEAAVPSEGSCVCLVATDAPLVAADLERIARRPFLGLARLGSFASYGSGEVSIAWTTQNLLERDAAGDVRELRTVSRDVLNELFAATMEATEEAVLNALCAGRDLARLHR